MPARRPRAANTYRANRKPDRQEKLAERARKDAVRQTLPRFLVGIRMVGQDPQVVRTSPLDTVIRSNLRIKERADSGRWTGVGDKGAKFINRQVGI